jgi:glycosyltransferase involved in cell wall biosynthesis
LWVRAIDHAVVGTALRAAFVMEQTLGHVTHYQNLAVALQHQTAVHPTWVLVPFATSGVERVIPAYASNWSVRASYRARRQLGRVLAERSHQALFFHTQVTSLFSVGLMRRIPSVLSLDATPINYDSVAEAYGHRPAVGSWLDQRKHDLNRAAFEAAAALVTWSEWAKASLVTDYGVPEAKVSVLAPGAGRHFFTIGAERVRREPTGRPVRLLFVGGDFDRKGGPLLLEAVRGLNTRQKFELHIVTQQAVPERPGVVVHHGVLPNSPTLHRLFRDADAFVLPSRGECLSVVLMEAGAAGLPIVATDVGALREAARQGENALLVRSGDVGALRGALEALVDDEALRARLGASAHVIARRMFDAETNNQRIVDLLAQVARPVDQRRVA